MGSSLAAREGTAEGDRDRAPGAGGKAAAMRRLGEEEGRGLESWGVTWATHRGGGAGSSRTWRRGSDR